MKIIRFINTDGVGVQVGVEQDNEIRRVDVDRVADLLTMNIDDFRSTIENARPVSVSSPKLLAPIDGATEVWASGVTYQRSREGRRAESAQADVYDLVYDAARPELFFKSVAWRVVGDGAAIGVRSDSELNVPEAEFALVLNSHAEVVGYTICDDVSSRSLEGANPLYLPQAKIYAGSCAIGPGIVPVWTVADPYALTVEVNVVRGTSTVWSASTSTAKLNRTLDELSAALFSGLAFPEGVVLSTGTGLVPELDVTLAAGDVVTIQIDGLGALQNDVVVGKEPFGSQWGDLKQRAQWEAKP